MLELHDVSVDYGMIRGLRSVSLRVERGQIVSLIGANGAGKSSLINAISGIVPLSAGSITFDGQRLDALSAEKIVERGVIQVPEGRQVFARMTVYENLQVGAYARRASLASSDFDEVFGLFPKLAERRQQLAGLMSGGEQQMLAIARAMMSSPKLLLLDEPSMGLAPLVVKSIFAAVETLNRRGISVLLVEQNARAALKLSEYAYVLTTGDLTRKGLSADLLLDTEIKEAFLGKKLD